jgi:hypothetical protein
MAIRGWLFVYREAIGKLMAAIPNIYARRLKTMRGALKAAVPSIRKDDPTIVMAYGKPRSVAGLEMTSPTGQRRLVCRSDADSMASRRAV